MKKSDYQFYSLTPIDDVDLGIYESALDFVFSDNKVKNVAVSGSYGAGKSSIIASYKKNHTDKKFLHISLAHFRQSDKEKETTNEEPFCNTEATLEGKILNQLIHQIPQNKIPLTNFRIKKSISKISNILTSALAIIGTLSGLYFFFFSKWTGFVDSLQKKWLKDSIDFSILPETRFFAGLGFIVISGIFAYNLIKLQKNKHIIKNANVSGVEIEIFQDCNESYFDKYLNDVLYLFENADSDVIVFEDIDRYDSISIFERLHEINTLVNNNREKNPLRFFYLLKDDIFENKDRTKFFDFIIPVVPVVDGSNSFNKFLECFEKSGVLGKGINREFLQGLSLYIDDMRILQNICNEFLIYHTRLSTTEQDPNKMLALIAYKNIFPRDFADLQLSKGFMFEIIGGKGKERLISSEKKRLKQELESKENEIKRVQEEILKGKGELSIVFCKKVFGHSGWWNWDETFRNQQLLSYENNIQYKPIIDEYKKRVSYIEENRISPLENEITKIKSERIALSGLRLSELITRENVDNFFKDTVFKSETGNEDAFNIIKDSPYFDMIKYLVREGYIDETYSDYMTYFYENSLSRNDKMFLRSVTDKKAKEWNYKLVNPELVISRLPLPYFEQEETLNHSLFDWLLSDYVSTKIHKEKALKFISQIQKTQNLGFILDYSEATNDISNMINVFGTEWKNFIVNMFSKYSVGDKPSDTASNADKFLRKYAYTLFTLCAYEEENVGYLNVESRNMLIRYVSNDAEFLSENGFDSCKVALGILNFRVLFTSINAETANKKLFEYIYHGDSYVANFDNIVIMLKAFYKEIDLTLVNSENYTLIMSDKESPLAKYVNNNIDDYMDIILANCDNKITDSCEMVISILNNPDINITKKETYIRYLHTELINLTDIEDTSLWGNLLQNSKSVSNTPSNITSYFFEKCQGVFDDTLISYINEKNDVVDIITSLDSEDKNSIFFKAIIKSISLKNNIYKNFLKQFNKYYNSFCICDIPAEKLIILDELKIIRMTAETLEFIRENYKDFLCIFIVKHIQEYISVVSDGDTYLFDEVLELLNEDISDDDKIALIDLDKNENVISIEGNHYSDKLCAYILANRYDKNDFKSIAENYEKFGEQSKEVIVSITIRHIEGIETNPENINRKLLIDLIESAEINSDYKLEIFLFLAPNATDEEIKRWLPLTGYNEFLKLYEENRRPKYDNTPINKKILEIFKIRGLIEGYELESDKFSIKRLKSNKETTKV